MSEEPAHINAEDQTSKTEIIDSVPGVEPTHNEEVPQQPRELIDSVPGVTPSESASDSTEKPSEGMEYHGGYTGNRLSADGTNPNVPVVNDPEKLGAMDALAQHMQGKSDEPKS